MPRDPDAPPAQLFLLSPPLAAAAPFDAKLKEALAAGDIACLLVRFATDDPGMRKTIAKALAGLAQPAGAALLVEGDPQLAARAGADGVHMQGESAALDEAIDALKPERIVGVGALASRDACMSVGERDIDYLYFGDRSESAPEILERTRWWAEIFNIPCVAYAHTLEDVAALSDAGADFIALDEAVWSHAQGPAAALAQALRATRAGAAA